MKTKKLLSVLMAIIMVIGLVPVTVSAADSCVAEVNGKKYEDLQVAIDAANDGDTVTLLADIDYTEASNYAVLIDKSLTLDLGEYTITSVTKDAAYAFDENEKDGLGVTTEYAPAALLIRAEAGSIDVTINATDGGIATTGAGYAIAIGNMGNDNLETDVTINGGVYYAEGRCCVYQNNGLVTINGGSFETGTIDVDKYLVLNIKEYYGGDFLINGGSFKSFDPQNTKLQNKKGSPTYNKVNWTAEGCTVTEADGWYTVTAPVAEDSVAAIGTVEYATLIEAVNAAEAGETVTMLKDIEITEATTFENKDNVTLDLNEKTITIKNESDYITIDGGSFTIMNGEIVSGGIEVIGGAKVTIENTEITADQKKFKYAVWAYESSVVDIMSGTYFGGKNGYDIFAENYAVATLYGGTYKFNIGQRYMADGCDWVKNDDKTYSVIGADFVAEVNGDKYTTLENAIEAAGENGTVTLLADSFVLDEGATLDLDGTTIVTTEGGVFFSGNNITIKNGAFELPEGDSGYYVLYIDGRVSETTATLNGIDASAGIQVIDADATLEDVTAVAGYNKNRYAVVAFAGANVTIMSGNYTTTHPNTKRALSMQADCTFNVKGGTYSKEVDGDYLAEGYICEKDGKMYVVIQDESYGVAEVNGVKYATLQEAIDAAEANDTVTLLANIEETIVITKSLTLDLGEYTVTGNTDEAIVRIYSPVVDTTIDVTVNATTGGIENYGSGFAIYAGEDLEDNDGNVADAERTNLTIIGGNYETAGTDAIRQIMGLCTINGGSYKSSFGRTVINGVRWYGSEFAINGGKFYGFNPACVSVWTGGNNGTQRHHHDIIAEGKTITYEDGWYTVVEGDEFDAGVKNKSLCYASLSEAISSIIAQNDAANLGELTLLKDATITTAEKQLADDKGITINCNDFTLNVVD